MPHTALLTSPLWLACLLTPLGHAAAIYQSDFEHGAGPEWSDSRTATTPAGCIRCTTFLGEFGNDTVLFALSNLADHGSVTLEFDLYLIRSWDGNVSAYGGPDIFRVRDFRRNVDFQTTFSNNYMYGGQFSQAFPDAYPGGTHPSQFGAVEVQTLGYKFDNLGYGVLREDGVYRMKFRFPHAEPSLILLFESRNLSILSDESWGLDNVSVSLDPVPEPTSLLLVGGGLLLVRLMLSASARVGQAPGL